MERQLTIIDGKIEIQFSDLDHEQEVRIKVIDANDNATTLWMCKENLISLRKHIGYVLQRINSNEAT